MAAPCCSFCIKPDEAVETLVAGPGVYICNECVGLCQVLIETKPRTSNRPRMTAWEATETLEDALASLPRVAATARQVEDSLYGWVGRARQLGASWASIGAALGMTRQSAWERFAADV